MGKKSRRKGGGKKAGTIRPTATQLTTNPVRRATGEPTVATHTATTTVATASWAAETPAPGGVGAEGSGSRTAPSLPSGTRARPAAPPAPTPATAGLERHQQLSENLDGRDEDQNDARAAPQREFFEGDRVWFHEESLWGDGKNPHNYRGFVKRVHEDSLDVVPMQSIIDGNSNSVRVPLNEELVFPDFKDFTLRFEVGEKVLCKSNCGWLPTTVQYLWPMSEIRSTPKGPKDVVPTYKCFEDSDHILAAPADKDHCIRRHPSSFRFKAGDAVVFDLKKAKVVAGVPSSTGNSWLEGTIVSVDITKYDDYAAYELFCLKAGSNNKIFLCHIPKDDDEHIARADADAGERLLEASKQCCSREHLRYLIESFTTNPPSSSWETHLANQILQSASYQALTWLVYEQGSDMLRIRDPDGNTVLHVIASNTHVTHFIREARRMEDAEGLKIWCLEWTKSLNKKGQGWLEILVSHGNTEALDSALSPHVGWAWHLSIDANFPRDQRESLKRSIDESGNPMMKFIFQSFASFCNMIQQYQGIGISQVEGTFERESMAVFMGIDALHHAKLLTRFIRDWQGFSNRMNGNPLLTLAAHGYASQFLLFFQADTYMYCRPQMYQVWSKEDYNNYIQTELALLTREQYPSHNCIIVDLISVCIIGVNGPSSNNNLDRNCRDLYLSHVVRYFTSCDHENCSLHKYLRALGSCQNIPADQRSNWKAFVENRANSLEDDANLPGRLTIIEYLVTCGKLTVTDVLTFACEVLRHRQCGVLRLIKEKGFLRLDVNVSSHGLAQDLAQKLLFFNGITSMSVYTLLSFAAVQYDDLQSLQWLCESGLGSPSQFHDGWNILHFAAYMGRVEIIGWLSTQPMWQTLISEVCRCDPYQDAFAIHIAVVRGHIYAAEMMMAMKVPTVDKKLRTIEHWAKESEHKFVQDWVPERGNKWIIEYEARRTISKFIQQNYCHMLATQKRKRLAQARHTISTFIREKYCHIVATQKRKRLAQAASSIQKYFRGHSVRRQYSGALSLRLEDSRRFVSVWGNLVKAVSDLSQTSSNWSSIREKTLDIQHVGLLCDNDYLKDTDDQLSRAIEGVLEAQYEDVELDHVEKKEELRTTPTGTSRNSKSWLQFQMTSHVIKFLKRGDPKYKTFFVRRMQQLANGDRSRILQKRLKGSDSTIYETYLEQKSGFRILWTEEAENIIIWFVAKHKEVSRFVKLIDDSKARTARQRLPESLITELQNNSLLQQTTRTQIHLDVFGNAPLKLYDFNSDSLDDIKTKQWTPKLHLTDQERAIVETEGTVLVLGRSGTGKTVCICNRIEYDRQTHGHDPTFSQLFVARSKRLCAYVAEATCSQNLCQTFDNLVRELDAMLPHPQDRNFFPSQQMNYLRFKDFHQTHFPKDSKVSALYVWTAIRTFILGSIEAFQSGGVLSREKFVDVERLGKNRCKIPVDLREGIYDEFLFYQKHKQQAGLWDDCDRIRHLVLRLDKSKKENPSVFNQVQRSRLYVDEIQDYTQLECLIFFYLGGPFGLFLAGDQAQSVVEGVELRFEEIRSLAYFIAGNGSERSFIPQKPKVVNVNFRSHAGILKCASAILDLLFRYFPGSAQQLSKDVGLFEGPRPGVIHKVDVQHLTILLSDKLKGTVVLCHDDSARHWRDSLGDYKLVYGIREAKGLEFRSVILLDFFRELPLALQRPWRDLLYNRVGLDFETKHPTVATHLKLLYTGITRCIDQLFFVEISSSTAGDATVRWLTESAKQQTTTQNALATQNNSNDIEAMSMTSDEFVRRGLDDAEMAELTNIDLESAATSMDRAIFCFEQAENEFLAAKARMHRRSIELRIALVLSLDQTRTQDKTVASLSSAQLMESLVKDGLFSESLNLFYSVRPFLCSYEQEELERLFVSKIRIATERDHS